jgi:hypothetical protein
VSAQADTAETHDAAVSGAVTKYLSNQNSNNQLYSPDEKVPGMKSSLKSFFESHVERT